MELSIELTEKQSQALEQYCEDQLISLHCAISRGLDAFIEGLKHAAAVDSAFGIWRDMGMSTDEYLKRIRAEWDRNSVWDEEQGCYVSPEGDESGFRPQEW